MLEYSAGAVSKGFWFQEFKKYLELLQMGKTDKEIRELQESENVFLAPSVSYGKRISGEISTRVKALPREIIKLFFNLNISDQKLTNLLGIMMTDRLFFEYMYEIYRGALIIGTKDFEDSGTRVFFRDKSEQSEKVAQYTEETKRRLAVAYKTYLKEANLIKENNGALVYNKPIIDTRLESTMKSYSLYPYLRTLTGAV